ncbi:glycoside hydrolase [Jaminaea rosea]|uniref:cellulase n=1 Tax=Jaminaea rosea TaxID=1569628 RepID=A0A316UPN7_9BASI|nr:glycoside hydrolase [Jaminaea rosea]PWN27266.1 glycoside hydrolase [Jaminaea rosea]
MSYNQENGWTGQVTPESDYKLYRGLGFNIFRYSFSWNLLQPDVTQSWNDEYYGAMLANVTSMLKDANVWVILDCHDFGRHKNSFIGEDAGAPADGLATMWATIASYFKNESRVAFGIMNEPEDRADTLAVTDYLQRSIAAIRDAGATSQYIFLPSKEYQGMSTWLKYSNYTLSITDPSDLLIYDIHSYLDHSMGGVEECEDFNTTRRDMYTDVTNALRSHNKTAFLSEIGGLATLTCVRAVNEALAFLDLHSDVWAGWTAWGPEQVQPDPREPDKKSSATAWFMDCAEGDLLHWAFLRRGSVGIARAGNSSCSPIRDSLGRPVNAAASSVGLPSAVAASEPPLPSTTAAMAVCTSASANSSSSASLSMCTCVLFLLALLATVIASN